MVWEPARKVVVGVDFDGTCVLFDYPKVGRSAPHAVAVLKELVSYGHQLILVTMRSDKEDGVFGGHNGLTEAVQWFEKHRIPLYGIQTNPSQKEWTESPKAYCHIYIDDSALGCPLIQPKNGKRPYVDWRTVRELLVHRGILPLQKQEQMRIFDPSIH